MRPRLEFRGSGRGLEIKTVSSCFCQEDGWAEPKLAAAFAFPSFNIVPPPEIPSKPVCPPWKQKSIWKQLCSVFQVDDHHVGTCSEEGCDQLGLGWGLRSCSSNKSVRKADAAGCTAEPEELELKGIEVILFWKEFYNWIHSLNKNSGSSQGNNKKTVEE